MTKAAAKLQAMEPPLQSLAIQQIFEIGRIGTWKMGPPFRCTETAHNLPVTHLGEYCDS